MKKFRLQVCFLIFIIFLIQLSLFAQVQNIYVSPTGNSTGTGINQSSAVTFQRAQQIIRANTNTPFQVYLMNGTYTGAYVFNSQDNRTASTKVTISALNKNGAIFCPNIPISRSSFQPISQAIKDRIIDPTAKNNVVMVSLGGMNLKSLNPWAGQVSMTAGLQPGLTSSLVYPFLFKENDILPLSKYPNTDFSSMTVKTILSNGINRGVYATSVTGYTVAGFGNVPTTTGVFTYKNDGHHSKWTKAVSEGMWLFGYWRVDWGGFWIKTQIMDTVNKVIVQSDGISGGIGNKYSKVYTINGYAFRSGNSAEKYWAVNLVEEIDMEGEYSIDFNKKLMYLWAPSTGNLSIADDPKLSPMSITGANNLVFENISFIGGSGAAMTITSCTGITIAGCTFSQVVGNGINLFNCTNSLILSNDMFDMGSGGVFISTSNLINAQSSQTSSNVRVINNHFSNFSRINKLYTPAVASGGNVGVYIAHNLIHGSPHIGIDMGAKGLTGTTTGANNNICEFNDIYDVVNNSSDVGAIYQFKTDFYGQGNKVRHNYIHNIGAYGNGIYWDGGNGPGAPATSSGAAGDSAYYNIIDDALYGVQNNGGFLNVYTNNIISSCKYSYAGNQIYRFQPLLASTLLSNYKSFYNSNPVYANAYPKVAAFFQTPIDTSINSTLYPRLTCSALLSTTGLGGSTDGGLFLTDGSPSVNQKTNVFTSTRIIFEKNYKIVKNTTVTSTNLLDSLKSMSAFSKTCGSNWQISRIGLYKDQYRTDISTTATAGKAPTILLTVTSICQGSPTNIQLTAKISNPNIRNCMTGFAFYSNGQSISGLSMTVTTFATTDLIQYQATWNNVSKGTYSFSGHVFDGTNFEFVSANYVKTITSLSIGGINGTSVFTCSQTTTSFNIGTVAGITSFVWSVPSGMVVTAGQGTKSVTVSITSGFSQGTVSVTGATACTLLNSSVFNVARSSNSWLGGVSSTWTNASNWCGGVPTVTSDVLINHGSVFQPLVFSNIGLKSLTINNLGVITITGTVSLTGDFLNNGSIYCGSTSGLIMKGTAVQTIGGVNPSTFNNLIITNSISGVVLNQNIAIGGTLTLGNGAKFTTTGYNFTLLSSSVTGLTARIGAIPANAKFYGDKVIMQRYIGSKKANRLISSPFTNANLTQLQSTIAVTGPNGSASGFDNALYNPPTLRYYVESVSGISSFGYQSATNINFPFQVGAGYQLFIRGDRNNINSSALASTAASSTASDVVITLSGSINQGNVTVPLTYTNTSNGTNDGWNLIGNPYPSEISFENYTFGPNVSPSIYLWDPQTSNTTFTTNPGRYITYQKGSGCSPNIVNCKKIASMQGFFVKANANTSVTFTEGMKTVTSANLFRTETQTNHLVIDLNPENEIIGTNDQTHLIFEDGASKTYENDRDALKLMNTNGTNISTWSEEGMNLVFNKIGTLIDTNSIKIPLIVTSNDTLKTIQFSGINSFDLGTILQLYDKLTNSYIEINEGTRVTIKTNKADTASISSSRLSIVAKGARIDNSGVLTIANQKASLLNESIFQIYPNPSESGNFIVKSNENGKLSILSITGNEVYSQSLEIGENSVHTDLAAGVYFARVNNNILKLIIR